MALGSFSQTAPTGPVLGGYIKKNVLGMKNKYK
jgi:hypothetical protein